MANEQLDKLITMALADGHISEDEWAILKRKAAALGVDEDELEMTILAKKTNQSGSQISKEPTEFLSQCPSCGSGGQRIISKCGYCGFTVDQPASQHTINHLLNALLDAGNMKIEEYKESQVNRDIAQSGKNAGGLFGAMLSHSNASMANLNETQRKENHLEEHKKKVLQRKVEIINNFPLPDSGKELHEFMAIAVSKVAVISKGLFSSYSEVEKEHNYLAPTWKMKCEQLMVKANVALKDDRSTFREIEKQFNSIPKK